MSEADNSVATENEVLKEDSEKGSMISELLTSKNMIGVLYAALTGLGVLLFLTFMEFLTLGHINRALYEHNAASHVRESSFKITKGSTAKCENGLCETFSNGQLIYWDEAGSFVVRGNRIDVEKQKDLTPERMAFYKAIGAESELNIAAGVSAKPRNPNSPYEVAGPVGVVDVKFPPVEHAVVYNGGQGLPVLHVFSDLNCGFCKKLSYEITGLSDFEVREYFVGLFDGSIEKGAEVMCSENRVAAAMNTYAGNEHTGHIPDGCIESYAQIIEENTAIFRQNGQNGTPAIFNDGGVKIGRGYAPADAIRQYYQSASL